MPFFGVARNLDFLGADDSLGLYLRSGESGAFTVQFDQHRVVDFPSERILYRRPDRPVAVRGELHAIRQARGQVIDECAGGFAVAAADHP